jgi:hypothetical protein
MNAELKLPTYAVLRGEVDGSGNPATKFDFGSNGGESLIRTGASFSWNLTPYTISSGCTPGSTSIVLNSVSGLAPEQILTIDQKTTSASMDDGTEGCTDCRESDRLLSQPVIITSINSNTVTFRPALAGPYWSQSLTPQAYTVGAIATHHNGLENIEVKRTANSDGGFANIFLINSHNSWVNNCKVVQANRSHIRPMWNVFSEVRHSYLTLYDSGQSSTYALRAVHATGQLWEDNIIYGVSSGIVFAPCVGCVAAYNFVTYFPWNLYPGNMPEIMMNHGNHPVMNLVEGNYTTGIWVFDDYHGNASYNTVVRNRITGKDAASTNPSGTVPISASTSAIAWTGNNVVGNYLGTSGYHDNYENNNDYSIYNNIAARTEILRKGNYNTVNSAVPAGESLGGSTISNSYYLAGLPSSTWWCAESTWPPVNPAGGSDALRYSKIPAQIRYEGATCTLSTSAPTLTGCTISGGDLK